MGGSTDEEEGNFTVMTELFNQTEIFGWNRRGTKVYKWPCSPLIARLMASYRSLGFIDIAFSIALDAAV